VLLEASRAVPADGARDGVPWTGFQIQTVGSRTYEFAIEDDAPEPERARGDWVRVGRGH
jgi:hypothetical protein